MGLGGIPLPIQQQREAGLETGSPFVFLKGFMSALTKQVLTAIKVQAKKDLSLRWQTVITALVNEIEAMECKDGSQQQKVVPGNKVRAKGGR